MKTENSLQPSDAEYFASRPLIFYNPYAIQESGSYFPCELHIIAQNPDTMHLRCFLVSLDDLCASSFRLLRLTLLHSCEGPIDPISEMKVSPSGKFVACSSQNTLLLYKIFANKTG